MAKYFEVGVTIRKRVFVKTEDHENCDSIQDYIHDANNHIDGDVEVHFPKQLTKSEDIEQSKRHADETIANC